MKKIYIIIFLIFFGTTIASLMPIEAQSYKENSINRNTEIEIPEDLKYNYDVLLEQWIKNLLTDPNEGSGLNDIVFFSDSIYAQLLYNLPSEMELAYNDEVKKFIEMYAGRNRSLVSKMLAIGKFYFPIFEHALDKEDLPLELKYLPCIESALNPTAKSRAGATGLWQFMAGTGKAYKLEINSLVDERRDPYKSTQAAVKYLKDMYKIYGDWNLVIAAYNCGPGNVNKAIAKSGGQRDYWKIYPYLPKETRGYVPAFIAATYIMNFNDMHNIHPAEISMPLLVDTIKVEKKLHLKQISEVLEIPIEDLRVLNPKFKTDIIPGGNNEYTLNLPISYLSNFIANEDKIFNYKRNEFFTHNKLQNPTYLASNSSYTHKVKKGETLSRIASKYGISKTQLKKMNGLTSDRLVVGKILRITDKTASSDYNLASSQSKSGNLAEKVEIFKENGKLKKRIKSQETEIKYVTVKSGDTWSSLSKKSGASIANIKKWNNIKGNTLAAGKKIKIITSKTSERIENIEEPQKIKINKLDLIEVIDNHATQTVRPNLEDMLSQYHENNLLRNIKIKTPQDLNLHEENSHNDDSTEYHNIYYGETISKIAIHYGITEKELLKWNGIDDKACIKRNIKQLRIKKPRT